MAATNPCTAFLLYRDREPLEFSKTKNPTRVWYRETKAEIEATKLPNGAYVIGTGEGDPFGLPDDVLPS